MTSVTLTAPEDLVSDWEADVDGDAVLDRYRFTRTPLVVDLVIGDHPLQLVVAHTKSNFINHGPRAAGEPRDAAGVHRRGAHQPPPDLRRGHADPALSRRAAERRSGRPIIVLGDLNDGPGLDYFEERYLTHNVTDIVVGSAFRPEWQFAHAQHDVPAADRYTAVFEDFVPTREVQAAAARSHPALPRAGLALARSATRIRRAGGQRRRAPPGPPVRPPAGHRRSGPLESGAAGAREVRHAGRGLDVDEVGVDQRRGRLRDRLRRGRRACRSPSRSR